TGLPRYCAHRHQRARSWCRGLWQGWGRRGVETHVAPVPCAGAEAVETRSRHSSYPAGTEEEEGVEEEELSPFRGRSSSAPPNLCAALRYGRELRRMSDEFQGSFKGLPRPKSAGTATQMRQSPSWTRVIQSWWDWNLGRGGSAPSQ
ncbi:bcl2-associated agonist of cell death, partial [Leptonychotes weddellii]|uniref:Bcl2-associated agonist of cell death n=1 Tax=Leptonychotes weddellii TaxID=9713 RepID=A0A7F8PX57_LEPWE